MSYKCLIGHKFECDGCGDCKKNYLNGTLPKQQLVCDCCNKIIEEDEAYYNISNKVLCKECLDSFYKYIN